MNSHDIHGGGQVSFTRWTCPICNQSRQSFVRQREGIGVGLDRLQSHIQNTAGKGHGKPGKFPSGFNPATLSEFVETGTQLLIL